ncbi:MAG: HIRAN domain-containing protein [Phycisphaerales bacterium]|nr:HIRAN domain-containing protein [Phycisphaerales bacterium]
MEGFIPYPEFQYLDKEYNGNVADIFGQRLTKVDRLDIKTFFDFWEVDSSLAFDKFYLLGKTQGLVATDNFEFLAEYKLTNDTHFLTEVAGLSHNKPQLERGCVLKEDKLRFELEPNNEYDRFAVKVFKGDLEIGYIKKHHNKIFHDPRAKNLKLEVIPICHQNDVVYKSHPVIEATVWSELFLCDYVQ